MPSPLLLNYIKNHPAEVAAQLEGNPVATVKDFIEALPDKECSYVISHLSAKYISAVTDRINEDVIALLCKYQPPYIFLRIYNTLSEDEQKDILPLLPQRYRWYIKYLSTQSEQSITTLISYDFLSLPENTTVDEARKMIDHTKHIIQAVYSHNEKNKITGEISIPQIYLTKRHQRLSDCKLSLRYAQPPSAMIEDVINLNVWNKKNVIPIIDHDKHLLGIVTINAIFAELIRREAEIKISMHDSAEQISKAVYSVLNSLASSYRKG